MNGYIDFHSHILSISGDDEKQYIEDTQKVLEILQSAKIKSIVCTNTFDNEAESIDDFLTKRDYALNLLENNLKPGFPKLIPAANVIFRPSLLELDGTDRLCISGTRYIVMEIPKNCGNSQGFSVLVDNLKKFIISRNIHPIISHIEQYLEFYSLDKLRKLSELGILTQISCSAIINRATRKTALGLFSQGLVQVIGSDDIDIKEYATRKRSAMSVAADIANKDIFSDLKDIAKVTPQYTDAVRIMRYNMPIGKYKQVKNNAGMIISNASIKDILAN